MEPPAHQAVLLTVDLRVCAPLQGAGASSTCKPGRFGRSGGAGPPRRPLPRALVTHAYVRPRSVPPLDIPRSRFARIARADLPFAAPSPPTKRFITTKHHGASPARCAPSHTRPAQLRRTQCICLVAPKRLGSHPSHRPCPLFCGRRRRRGLQHVDEAHGPSSSGSSSSIRWRRLQRQWQEQQQQWSSPPQGGAGSPGSSISRSSNSIVSHRRGAWPAAAAAAAATAVEEHGSGSNSRSGSRSSSHHRRSAVAGVRLRAKDRNSCSASARWHHRRRDITVCDHGATRVRTPQMLLVIDLLHCTVFTIILP